MGNEKYNPNPSLNPYRAGSNPYPSNPHNPSDRLIDFEAQRFCPSCGKILKIGHNFCKYCGVDLGKIAPIGSSDEISKQLAITAVTDPDPEVRKEAVNTLGNFKDIKVLGVLTYILLNDPNELVRKEAADEIGDLHHPCSLEALSKALKDQSPMVRKEAIEGLKKIKEKSKEEEYKKGKPEERGIDKEDTKEDEKKDSEKDTDSHEEI
jgi:hypothetical protein